MNRKFLVNIIFLVILNLLIKPFWFFGIEVTVQNRLSNAAYGTYFSLLSFSLILNFLLDFGITNYNTREIAKHNQLISKYFSNIFGIKIFLGICYLLFCLVAAIIFQYSRYELFLLSFLVLNQFLAAFILYLRSNISGMLMFITDSILSVLDKALMILFLSLLLWTQILGGKFKVEYFVWSQTLSFVITAFLAFVIVQSKCLYFSPKINFKYLKIILKASIPFSILVLLMSLYNRFEPVLLERLLPDGNIQAGIYAQGYRLLEVLTNFAYLFPILLLPLFSKLLKQKDELNQLISLAVPMLFIPAITISIALSVYGAEIMNTLYGRPLSGEVFCIIILGFLGISLTYLYGTLLTANGNLKQLNIMALSAVVINICMNLILIPEYKAKGAAIASLVTQTLTGLVQVYLAYKLVKLKADKSWLYKIPIWATFYFLSIFVVTKFVYNWKLGITILMLVGIGIAFILKLLNMKEMIRILINRKQQ